VNFTLRSFVLRLAVLLPAVAALAAPDPLRDRPISEPTATAPRQGGTAAEPSPAEKSVFDNVWDAATIYKNKDAAFLNEFRFVGRLHLDEYQVDSDLGADQDWIERRLRLGVKALMFHNHLTAHVEVDLTSQYAANHQLYQRLTDAYLAWKFCDAAKLTVGKHSAKFTLDGSTSSNELLTIDRNNLTNNFWFTDEYIPGISLSGNFGGGYQYNAGIFSGGTASPEFGNFDAGNFGLVSFGYDFAKQLGVKKALIRADYVYNQRNVESTWTKRLENIGSIVGIFEDQRWGFSADVSRATGYGGQGDLTGVVGMPWFNITDKLQAVARYTYISGDKDNSVRLARYENTLTSGRGDEYNEIYAGLNYYFYGHKLKLQSGWAYATLHDRAGDGGRYAGWSWTNALRVSW
jgi:phosphate-selective porin OprO/OprP